MTNTKSTKCSKEWVEDYIKTIEEQSSYFIQDTIFYEEKPKSAEEEAKEQEEFRKRYIAEIEDWEFEFKRKNRKY